MATAQKVTLVLPQKQKPPAWKDLARCQTCSKPFNLIRRHHHCRHCGGDFCGDCCNKKTTIPKFGWVVSEVLVCPPCYLTVTQEIDDFKRNRLGTSQTAERRFEEPPAWVYSKKCHSCAREFTQTFRDHHCRHCGMNFCGDCSSKTSSIPKFGWFLQQARVCNECHRTLTSSGQNSINIVAATPSGAVISNASASASSEAKSFSSPSKQSSKPQPAKSTPKSVKKSTSLSLNSSSSTSPHSSADAEGPAVRESASDPSLSAGMSSKARAVAAAQARIEQAKKKQSNGSSNPSVVRVGDEHGVEVGVGAAVDALHAALASEEDLEEQGDERQEIDLGIGEDGDQEHTFGD